MRSISLAKRVFKHKSNIFPDPNRELSEKDVLAYYGTTHPELASCSVFKIGINDKGEIEYEFKEGLTPKG